MKKTYRTTFAKAVNWCHNSLILCNNIPEVDESIWDNFEPVVDVSRDEDDEDEENADKCPECGAELDINTPIERRCSECDWEEIDDIYQWYLTDCDEDDMVFLRDHFGLMFTYSDLLDCYVLCVTHCGTAWTGVGWTTDLPQAACDAEC